MPFVALVCAGLLGWADGNAPIAAVAAEYQQIKATSGHTADDQVRLALWCEAHGLTAERMRHLALAVLADPTHATARGLSGLVAREGRWVAPDAIAQTVQADAITAARLAEYDQKRSKTPYTADAQWGLGIWADKHDLKDQAKAHFTAVTRLDPGREVAWNRLGYKKYGGRWETEAQVSAARAEAEAQKQADRVWRPILERSKTMLNQPSHRDQAQVTLLGVTDPRALHSVGAVFGHGTAADQAIAVQLLGQIQGGPATLALAQLAVHGHSPLVRRDALESLAARDPRDCVESLVQQIQTPWKYEVRPVAGPGSVGVLFVKGERFNVRRLYSPPSGPPLPDGAGTGTTWRSNRPVEADVSTPRKLENYLNAQIAVSNALLAARTLQEHVREVEAANAKIHSANERVLTVLTRITGLDLGENRPAWARWDTERLGFAYQSSTADKPTFTEMPDLAYQSPVVIPTPHAACFGVGTPVRTISGTKPIDQVQPGDLVLVQNTASGTLSYQPVLTAFHNPPSVTYRIKLADDEIVATGIHRFWQAGKGWIMARDLRVGDVLRVIGGVAAVEAVAPERVQPVFNLEVAEGRSFFVGRVGALVHDNSLVEATPNPFDAPPAVASVATSR